MPRMSPPRLRDNPKAQRVRAPRVPVVPEAVEPKRQETEMTLAGVTYRILSEATGPYVRSDGKGQIDGIGFISVEPV
jgi:hypothetical protein